MRKTLIFLSSLLLLFACKPMETENATKQEETNSNSLKEFRATLSDLELKSIATPGNGKISWEKGGQGCCIYIPEPSLYRED